MNFTGADLVVNVTMVPLVPALATLSGEVTDADTGQPITLVLVEIVGVASTTTDNTGHYLITDIPQGTYTVRFSHPQYMTTEL